MKWIEINKYHRAINFNTIITFQTGRKQFSADNPMDDKEIIVEYSIDIWDVNMNMMSACFLTEEFRNSEWERIIDFLNSSENGCLKIREEK